jgi:hypothetical protein
VHSGFFEVLSCPYAAWLEMYKALTLAPLTTAQFEGVEFWGDPHATRDLKPLMASSGLSHLLLKAGILRVSQSGDDIGSCFEAF